MESSLSNALRSEKDMSIDFQKDKQDAFSDVNTNRKITEHPFFCNLNTPWNRFEDDEDEESWHGRLLDDEFWGYEFVDDELVIYEG